MDSRTKLHALLVEFADNVYFQPPSNIRLTYPCIVYSKIRKDDTHANNNTYVSVQAYQLTVIDQDPDSIIADAIEVSFEMCSITAYFTRDNLNQTTLTLYY